LPADEPHLLARKRFLRRLSSSQADDSRTHLCAAQHEAFIRPSSKNREDLTISPSFRPQSNEPSYIIHLESQLQTDWKGPKTHW
jgi:hypothetical protein